MKKTSVLRATIVRVCSRSQKGTPASIWRTASMTTRPAATPISRVSMTTTGKSSIVRATMRTVSQVAESPDEMLTNTAALYPSAFARASSSAMRSGEGSEVLGISCSKRRTTSSVEMSTPLSYDEPSE